MDYGIIDCDFHPTVADVPAVMREYLTREQVERLKWLGVADIASGSELQRGYRGSPRPVGRSHHFVDNPHPEYRPADGGGSATDLEFIQQTYLDPEGVDAAILIPLDAAMADAWTYPEEASWYVSAINSFFLEHWVGQDPRLSLNLVVSPLDIDLAVKEIHKHGADPGVAAVFLPMTDRLFGHRMFYPIWEALCEYDLPLMVHTMSSDDIIGTPQRAGGQPGSWAERYITLGQFGQSHLASLIFDGAFERYPALKVIFVEFGWPWVPQFCDRMDVTWKAARRHHPWMKKLPSEYVRSSVRFTSEPTLEVPNDRLGTLLDWLHADEVLLYSSDYPHWDSEQPKTVFSKLSPELRRRIYRDNAVEFFGQRLRLPTAV